MREIHDKYTGAILFKKDESDLKVDRLEEEVAELKRQLALLLETKKQDKSKK